MAPRQTLEESIAHLRQELADGQTLSAQDRVLLEQTLADVAQVLDVEQDDPAIASPIYDALQDLAERLERTRPTLSLVVGRIADSLSQLGI
jgi:hypothetical protein